MKPVFQTRLRARDGDCFRACIASIMEMKINEVPDVPIQPDARDWFKLWNQWLNGMNLQLVGIGCQGGDRNLRRIGMAGYSIGLVRKPNWPKIENIDGHAVVFKDLEFVWDPDPRAPKGQQWSEEDWLAMVFLVPLDPCQPTGVDYEPS